MIDLNWNDPNLLKMDLSQNRMNLAAALVQALNQKIYLQESMPHPPTEDHVRALECATEMVNILTEERDLVIRIQSMQDLFRTENINPACEVEWIRRRSHKSTLMDVIEQEARRIQQERENGR